MALPLLKPAGGYLRLSFEGAAEVTGTQQQSWDLTAIPEGVRAHPAFRRSILALARPVSPGLALVEPEVDFFPATGTPTEMVLTVTAGAPTDELALDVWVLHSIVGAVSDASKLYFIPVPGGGAPLVTSVFGRTGAVVAVAGDYAASLVNNDSGVAGANVAAALDNLLTALGALSSNDIANASGVAGATVTAALDALNTALGALSSNNISNASGVAGADVTAALNTLAAAIASLTSSNIANASGVAGATVTAALNTLNTVATTRYIFERAETNGADAGHRVRNVGAAGNFDFNFHVPGNFAALVSLQIWGASRTCTNPAAPISLTSSYGQPGAGPASKTTGPTAITPAFTAGIVFGYSVASVFPALAANDRCGYNVNHGGIGGSIDYYGTMLRYTT